MAKKVLEDLISDNSYYCQIGLFTEKQLNLAEYSLFSRLDFEVNYNIEDLEQVYNEIFESLPNQRKNEYVENENYNINQEKDYIDKSYRKNNIWSISWDIILYDICMKLKGLILYIIRIVSTEFYWI